MCLIFSITTSPAASQIKFLNSQTLKDWIYLETMYLVKFLSHLVVCIFYLHSVLRAMNLSDQYLQQISFIIFRPPALKEIQDCVLL